MNFHFFQSFKSYRNFHLFRPRTWYLIFPFGLFSYLYLATLMAGFQGIANGFGWFLAVVTVVAAMGFGLGLPLVVAAYIHAMNVWGWPMAIAALFATGPQIWLWIEQQFSHARLLNSPWPRQFCLIFFGSLLRPLFVVQLVAGFEGIENGISFFWAVVAVASHALFHFDLPLAAGAYLHATNSWSWHPAMAVPFAIGRDICVLMSKILLA